VLALTLRGASYKEGRLQFEELEAAASPGGRAPETRH
jgi:hypothetical protein